MSDQILTELGRDAWQLHTQAADNPWLVTPSAPVLFFGNHTAYRASPVRIATVALNPSRQEFPAQSPFSRFPGSASGNIGPYLASLESYFQVDPLRTWFNSFEQALSGLGASYYGQKPSVALHTDIGSVLPTDPTWRKLNQHVRAQLAASGVPLWHRLIEYLEPEILLWSTARLWLNSITFTAIGPWSDLRAFQETKRGKPREQPIFVRGRQFKLQTGARVLIAFVRAAQTPLGHLSDPQKVAAGEAILSAWREGGERT